LPAGHGVLQAVPPGVGFRDLSRSGSLPW
jgi:hypothetical protein